MRRATFLAVLLLGVALGLATAGWAEEEARTPSTRDPVASISADDPAPPLAGCAVECCCALRNETQTALSCTDREECEAIGGICESPRSCE